jgi:protein-arginine kinase activator protein McsA
MDPILAQILELVERAPLTTTGKEDIRHTIRTEVQTFVTSDYEPPKRRIRLADPEETDCETCPVWHKHSRNNGVIGCIDCGCMFTPYDKPAMVVSRVKLV